MAKRSSMSVAVLPRPGAPSTKPERDVTAPDHDARPPASLAAMRSSSMPAARNALPSMMPAPAAPMPPCAAEVDQDLMDSMEQLFADGNATVLVAFEVLRIKQSEDTTGTQLLKALGAKSFLAGRHAPAPRVLCFTLRRSKTGEQAFKPYLTLVKPVDAYHYKVKHSYPLRLLEQIKLAPGKMDFGGMRLQVLELTVGGAGQSTGVPGKPGAVTAAVGDKASVELPAFGVADPEQLNALLAVATQLMKQAELPLPKLSGLDAANIAKWWTTNGPGLVARLGEFSAEVLTGSHEGGAHDAADTRVLVSAKEEKDLEDLLDMYAMGMGDVGEFEARLMDEHEALEAANIHSLLSNVPMVDSVVFQLKRTAQMLEDVDETLQVFGVKLRHMRQDIGAIEQYNNTLELTARNNAKLMAALKSLLSELRIPSEMRNSLEDPPFDKERLTAVLKPGWALVSKLSRLQPGTPTSLNPHLLQMRVVREAREDMTALAKVFVTRAAAYLSAKITQVVEELALEVGKSTDRAARTKPADHEQLQTLRKQHSDLMRLVKSLDAQTLESLRSTYTRNTNLLLRKELRVASGELRKAAALDAQQCPIDFGLTKDTAAKAAGGSTGVTGGSEGASLISDLNTYKGPGSVASKQSRSSMHMIIRPRASNPLDGTTLSMPLNEAWTALLDSWLPCLLEESQAAAAFMLLYVDKGAGQVLTKSATFNRSGTLSKSPSMARGGPPAPILVAEARGMLEQLCAGMEPEFQVLVDAASKGGQQFLGLPMMAQTTWWLQQLLPSPEATPLVLSLSACHARLKAQVSTYRAAQLQLIEAYASKASGGVKSLHVLAFTFQFSLLIHHLEQVLASEPGIQELMKAQEGPANKSQALPAWLGDPSTSDTPSTLATDTHAPSKNSKTEAVVVVGLDEQHQRVKAALNWQCRLEVDEVYTSLVGCMFSTLERMAVMDPKHGHRLRLENYAYFAESVRPLLRYVSALQPYLQQAEDRQEESLTAYMQQQLEYSTIWKALDFSIKIDRLLEVVNPTEIPFQAGCSASDARSLLTSAMKEPAKQLASVAARVRKHLGASTLALRVWERTSEELLNRYERLEAQLLECYPQSAGVVLNPSPGQLADLLTGMGSGA